MNARIAGQQEQLSAKSDELKTTVDRIESSVNQLVAKGKITKEEAQAVLNIALGDVKADIKGEVKTP